MSYATVADLDERYGPDVISRLSDKDNTGERVQAAIERALDDADVLIDGFLDGRYPLPLATIPRVLGRVATSVARYYLEESCATERAEKDFKDAMKLLEKIGKGEISLGLSDTGERPDEGLSAEIVSSGRVWARGRSGGFI